MKKILKAAGANIEYDVKGDGDAVIILHGFCENRQVWNKLLDTLPEGFKYVIPDLPGFGQSEVIENPTMKIYAGIIRDIALAENIERLILIGHSMGGYIAMEFVRNYPTMINGLVMFHSHVYADDEKKKADRYKSIEFIQKNGASTYIDEFVPKMFGKKATDAMIAAQKASLSNQSTEGLAEAVRAMAERSDTSEVMKTASFSVLFILGENDQLMPVNNILKQAELPPVAQTEVLQNSGHMGMLEETAKCGEIISKYIKNIRAA